MPKYDLVSAKHIAEMAGVTKDTVYRWRSEDPTFPEPATEVHGGKLYERSDIIEWLFVNGLAFRSTRERMGVTEPMHLRHDQRAE